MADSARAEVLRFAYTFRLPGGTQRRFDVRLDAESLMSMPAANAPKPAWTKLQYYQCANCPMSDDVERCPVAVNLAAVVETFKDAVSFESATVTVETTERIYEKTTTLQKGISSIIGIYMVTSNCPVMDRLRPMVRFHLPFASVDETVYRAVAMYLVAQYFRMRSGRRPDWGLEHLADVYAEVAKVNAGMMERLRHASTEDANANALAILSEQGGMIPMFLEESLAGMEHLFRDLIDREG